MKLTEQMEQAYQVSMHRCRSVLCIKLIKLLYYKPSRKDASTLRFRTWEIAENRVGMASKRSRFYCQGWCVNHQKVHYLWCEEGLNLCFKSPIRNVSAAHHIDQPKLSSTDQCWSMDEESLPQLCLIILIVSAWKSMRITPPKDNILWAESSNSGCSLGATHYVFKTMVASLFPKHSAKHAPIKKYAYDTQVGSKKRHPEHYIVLFTFLTNRSTARKISPPDMKWH